MCGLAEPPIGVSQFADLGELLRGRGDVLWPVLAAIGRMVLVTGSRQRRSVAIRDVTIPSRYR